ncbi:MAG: LysR family transcriptional regulator, partial [Raoultibacter sp.]
MRIESLALFLSVVEKGSISRAARHAYISQQGASSVIKSLEQDFGILLFSRGGHTLQLTEAGQRFAREADRVVAAYRQLQMVAALGNAETFSESEPLRVVTTPFTLLALAPIFDAYRETIQCVDSLVFIEKSAFEIIDEYPHLDKNALYLVNIPTFMTSIVKK